jgi:hypothetical protein
MITNEALLRLPNEKASCRQFVSEVGYDRIKNLSPSDTFIYNVCAQRVQRRQKCRIGILRNLKRGKSS